MSAPLDLTKTSRVMVFAPHPDDETLGAGGLLQAAVAAGGSVRVVFATEGENNPWPQRFFERRWRIGAEERKRWGRRRREEASKALACLGVPLECASFLGLPDQGITELLLRRDPAVAARLAEEISRWRPTLLVAPSSLDIHPDHSALGVLLHLACSRLEPGSEAFDRIDYIIHARWNPEDDCPSSLVFPLLPEQQARKREAILCHATQVRFRKRMLLGFASASERFVNPAAPRGALLKQPVSRAAATSKTLWMVLSPRSRLGAFGRKTILVVGEGGEGRSVRCSAVLPRRSARIDLKEPGSGDSLGTAAFCGKRGKGELSIPAAAWYPLDRLFVKLERRFGFFDEGGWLDVAVPKELKYPALHEPVEDSPGRPIPGVCCVIPCYNVAQYCGDVVRETARYAEQVIAVNDGSRDETGEILHAIASESKGRVRVLSLMNNCGKGVALMKGFRYASERLSFSVLITLDADGQHRPADIPRLARAFAEEHADLVIGERTGKMPFRSRIGNRLATILLRRRYPCGPLDTQSGLRAMTGEFVQEVVRCIPGGRYETEINMLMLALERRKRVVTVPIQTIYLDKNRSSHFRPLLDALRVWRAMAGFRSFVSKEASGDTERSVPGTPPELDR